MKKIVYIALGITLILSILNVFISLSNRLSMEFLFNDNQHSVEINLDSFENPELDFHGILQHLLQFSKENDTVIMKYSMLGNEAINIYTTNFLANSRIELRRGTYPEANQFLSNRPVILGGNLQSGQIVFPFSNWDIRIHHMEQVSNVGFGHRTIFHFLDTTDEVVERFIEEFSIYSEPFLSDDWQIDFLRDSMGFHLVGNYSYGWLGFFSTPLGTAIFFSYLILFLVIILYLMKQRQRFLLEDLWGYTKVQSFIGLLRQFCSFIIFTTIFFVITISMILFVTDQITFLIDYISYFFLSLAQSVLVFFSILVVMMLLMRKNHQIILALKGKSFFERLQWSSFSIKVILLTMLFIAINGFFSVSSQLRGELKQMAYWEQAQDVFWIGGISIGFDNQFSGRLNPEEFFEWYTVRGGNPYEFVEDLEKEGMSLEEYLELAAFIVDYEVMRRQDELLTELFLQLEEHHHGFFLDAMSFSRIPNDYLDNDDNREFGFLYEWFSSFSGVQGQLSNANREVQNLIQRKIIISYRYLEFNEILDENNSNVLNALIHDPLVLNVLVPIRYIHLENELISHYLEEFYFNKVVIENDFRPQLGLPLIELARTDLSINLIFTLENQTYFSYSRDIGDFQSQIVDPIVMIHNPFISPAQTAARVTGILYFRHEGREGALDALQPLLDELGVVQINFVQSVFAQGNENLIHLQWALFQQTLNMVMNISFSLLLCAVLIWAFYQGNAYKINLHYLFGYSFWERNRELIVMVVLANLLGTVLFSFFSGFTIMAVIFLLGISLVDILMIKILGNYLTKRNTVKILKGGEL